jgi:putative salt-induced outer membrane protein
MRFWPVALLLTLALPAVAAPVPKPVADMLRIAVDSGDPVLVQSMIRTAKTSNPNSSAEIDILYKRLTFTAEQRRQARLRRQRYYQGWVGKGEFGAFDTSGQVNSTGITAGLSLVRDGLRWKQSFSAAVDYLHHNGVEERDRYFAGHQANYKINDRIYALGLASWEGNRAQGFNSRFIASVGAGVSVINRKTMSLSVEASPAVRETSYLNAGTDSALAARVAGNYHWDMTSRLTLTEAATYYKESRDETLTSEAALTMKLIGALSTRFSYRLQKENQTLPLPTAINTTDTTSRLSLVYTF